MEDAKILELYWARSQDAVAQTQQRYGAHDGQQGQIHAASHPQKAESIFGAGGDPGMKREELFREIGAVGDDLIEEAGTVSVEFRPMRRWKGWGCTPAEPTMFRRWRVNISPTCPPMTAALIDPPTAG